MKSVVLVFAILLAFVNPAKAQVFSFIYVEAGEGNSSGGHAAVGFGDQVFHYQYENGLLRLFNHKADNFRNHYQLLQNRSLHIADIEVNAATYDRLLSRFKDRLFQQQQRLKLLNALQQNQALLHELLKIKGEKPPDITDLPALNLALPGAGLFYPDDKANSGEANTAECRTAASSAEVIATVRQSLEHRFGTAFLPQQINAIKTKLGRLSPLPDDTSFDSYPFSEHYSDLLNELLALQVLQRYKPLAGSACFKVNKPELRLSESQVRNAQAYQRLLFDSAVSLTASKRPDKGYALLVTLARMIAVEQSIQSKHWVFIDDTKETSAVIPKAQLQLYAEDLRQKRQEDAKRLAKALASLGKAPKDYSLNYVSAEMAANRVHQWHLSDTTQALRYRSEQTLPEKSIAINRFLFSGMPVKQLKLALNRQEQLSKKLTAEDGEINEYHLLTHNCVSALFATINRAMAGQSEKLLGGYIDPAFNFIPFQAFDAVQSTYRVVKTRTLPSYRQQKLAEIYNREGAALAYLREANVFSSSLYNHNPEDAWFVFFTDDAALLRPLYGAVNTVSAVGQSLAGLFTWPFDAGNNLKLGAKGVVASLPELAFFNIRKGSYPYNLKH